MSFYTHTANDSYDSYIRRDIEIEQQNAARFQAEKFWESETHCRDAADYEQDEVVGYWLPVQQFEVEPFSELFAEAGVTTEEAAALVSMIERRPAKIARMQMELFPEVA